VLEACNYVTGVFKGLSPPCEKSRAKMTTESECMEASNANVATFLARGFVRNLSNITLAVPSCIVLSDL